MPYNKAAVFRRIAENNSTENFIEFAVFMRRVRQLSFFNSGLIYLQRPGALYVLNEAGWEKVGRFVRPEATPIIITVPFGPVEFVYDLNDTYGAPFQGLDRDSFMAPPPVAFGESNLRPAIEMIRRMGIYFTTTDGYGASKEGSARLLDQPIKVTYMENKKVVEVYTRFAIIVDNKLPDAEKVRVIFHEIGHILCGHFGYVPEDKKENKKMVRIPERDVTGFTKFMQEYEAEKVCELFCSLLGYEYDPRSYLADYEKTGEQPDKDNRFYIMNAVDTLLHYWNKAN